jgi:hypothetical protein
MREGLLWNPIFWLWFHDWLVDRSMAGTKETLKSSVSVL